MTETSQDITEGFYAGDTKDIEFTVTSGGSLKDLASSEITYCLIYDDGKNPLPLFWKSSEENEIDVTGLGKCVVHLLPADSVLLNGTFRHQLHVFDENADGEIVSTGKVMIFRAWARRTRKVSVHAYVSA